MTHDILPIGNAQQPAVLALNNAFAAELSLLSAQDLSEMLTEAFWARRVGDIDAFLIAFDQDAAYDSPNFLWFRQRYPRFVYVDRVVTAPHARGRGLARRLYQGLFDEAAGREHAMVVCEVNMVPPNPASDSFHAALGFDVVGSAYIHGGAKVVRYFLRHVAG